MNELLQKNTCGRLFAVVHIAGKQFKITEGDVIVIEGYWPPDVGDKIKLDKVLLRNRLIHRVLHITIFIISGFASRQ